MTIVYSTYTIGPSTSGGTDNTAAATRRARFMMITGSINQLVGW